MLCFVVITAGGGSASACSCVGFTDPEAFARARAVFTGTLVSIEELPTDNYSSTDPQRLVFEVAEVFKGEAAARQTIVTEREGASCGLEVTGPGPFLVFTEPDPFTISGIQPGELYAGMCGGTHPLADGAVPAAFGQSQPPGPASAEPPLASTGADGDGVRWLIPIGAALIAIGAITLRPRWSRPRGE